MSDTSEAQAACRFAHEIGYLKRTPRTGWQIAGVPGSIESVADHSLRVSLLAHMIAAQEGANPDRAATLGAYHDVHETRIGDIPHLGRRYVTAADPEAIVKDQTLGMADAAVDAIRAVVAEFEQGQTPEAIGARDADKLDCLLQAIEYGEAGARDIDAWIETSYARLRTTTAIRIADVARSTRPGDWWRAAQTG